jgi:Lon protease-like protein
MNAGFQSLSFEISDFFVLDSAFIILHLSGLQSIMLDETAAVPLFPLPNVVLFPQAVLPLHIFEERYKTMTADALAGDRLIAIALLQPGWEKNYHGAAAIAPVVCIATILAHERLVDGKYNLLLQGTARATVVRELTLHPYRTAELQALEEPKVLEIDLSNQRRALISIFSNGRFSSVPLCQKFLEMLSSPASTGDIADLVAFNLLDDLRLKQQLLSEPDPRRRTERVAAALESLQILSAPQRDEMSGDLNMN